MSWMVLALHYQRVHDKDNAKVSTATAYFRSEFMS